MIMEVVHRLAVSPEEEIPEKPEAEVASPPHSDDDDCWDDSSDSSEDYVKKVKISTATATAARVAIRNRRT